MRSTILATTVIALLGCRRDNAVVAPEPVASAPSSVVADTPPEPREVVPEKNIDCSEAAIEAVMSGTAKWTDEGPACFDRHEAGCKAGDGDACILAGTILINGLGGVKPDPPGTLALEMKACDDGVAAACLVAAALHQQGMGTTADEAKATALVKRACELGDERGCAAIKSAEREQAALVPGANVTVESIAADGLELRRLACAVESMPLFGTIAIVGSFAKQKRAIDRCAPQGQAFQVTWTFASGRVKDVVAEGGTPRANACIAKAMSRAVAPVDGRCGAVVLAGKPKAAAASADALRG